MIEWNKQTSPEAFRDVARLLLWIDFLEAAPKGQYMPYKTFTDCEEDCEINDRHALIQMERFRVFCVFKRMTR